VRGRYNAPVTAPRRIAHAVQEIVVHHVAGPITLMPVRPRWHIAHEVCRPAGWKRTQICVGLESFIRLQERREVGMARGTLTSSRLRRRRR